MSIAARDAKSFGALAAKLRVCLALQPGGNNE